MSPEQEELHSTILEYLREETRITKDNSNKLSVHCLGINQVEPYLDEVAYRLSEIITRHYLSVIEHAKDVAIDDYCSGYQATSEWQDAYDEGRSETIKEIEELIGGIS